MFESQGSGGYLGNRTRTVYVVIDKSTLMYAASELGVHSVRPRGFDSVTVAETFVLPENIIPVMMFAMGYPSEQSKPHAWHFLRKPIGELAVEL